MTKKLLAKCVILLKKIRPLYKLLKLGNSELVSGNRKHESNEYDKKAFPAKILEVVSGVIFERIATFFYLDANEQW